MKVYLLFIILITNTSCLKISGNLKVNNSLSYYSKGNLEKLERGEYKGSLRIKNSKKIVLKTTAPYSRHKIIIRLPKKIKLPQEQDHAFKFSQESLNQPFSIEGLINNQISFSTPIYAEESCRLNTSGHPCANIWIGRRGNRNLGYYDYQCIPSYVMGTKDVWYRKKIKKTTLDFYLVQDEIKKSEFKGSTTKNSRQIISESRCSLY